MEGKKTAVILFDKYEPLECHVCKRDLFTDFNAVIAFIQSNDDFVDDVYWACKGKCDEIKQEWASNKNADTEWEDIRDLTNPIEFQRWQIAILNRIKRKDGISDVAFCKIRDFILCMGQFVYREPSGDERKRFLKLDEIRKR
jgi:hypothetical protein